MARTPSNMIPLGTIAPEFYLKDTNSNNVYSFEDLKGSKGTLVIFMCNHCPFVLHVINEIVMIANDYRVQGLGIIAISSNDIIKYPEDSPELMTDFALQHKIDFPYLFDETQETAKAYEAACTPDFYLFDNQNKLFYRGQLDDSRPGNGIPLSGTDLRNAIDALIYNRILNEIQKPSIGCNIKWK
ncbi:thioredoxin family protein [Flavobacterium johnsoniae]|jgi:peroxiredoxin|uniref:Alkyl hydroperoxide reductase/ Thiol specific antioxidant/ Mal allergen n=1 Tax=Flavobacterium johnsoniae (strain ATCC 17061 / DSM 2064 / JCM 8514 / BCRC 14874 / CCUG 350202 / NBRC 14942 / NCIMB 11054 / UW101) TaxID=376686 RepID=A5FHU9_FLAJ1|nr:thioredoxin family protein [Flavobacterium johnsoniae]ABQ05222.1 alkyl hydroperoxide reductase/ Thiol specific antioxidant/ Mal allergen [Flavobacterium johnsoniae UW101]OXE96936.1 thioredoxin family protein [Flavobacterium johnsoniae UW101]WQG82974.1 thioredoxin family protein [Flavobacterium johnsoniae UW101]SHL63256.1 Peroxiredoxin [Flavobacterium johnsoniae]